MNELLLANLFFIITGSAVLVVGTFLCILCFHLITFMRKARAALDRMEASAEALIDDVKTLRDRIANGGIFGKIVTAVVGALAHAKWERAVPRRKKEDSI